MTKRSKTSRFVLGLLAIAPIAISVPHATLAHAAAGAAEVPDPRAGQDPVPFEDALQVVEKMTADPKVRRLLPRAKAVLVMPNVDLRTMSFEQGQGRAMLLVRGDEGWRGPLFYRTGRVSLGAYAGADVGALGMLVLRDEALYRLVNADRLELSQDTGFNMSNNTPEQAAAPSEGDDIVIWSDAAGIFPGTSVRLYEIRHDPQATVVYYGRPVTIGQILRGEVPSPQAGEIRQALAPDSRPR